MFASDGEARAPTKSKRGQMEFVFVQMAIMQQLAYCSHWNGNLVTGTYGFWVSQGSPGFCLIYLSFFVVCCTISRQAGCCQTILVESGPGLLARFYFFTFSCCNWIPTWKLWSGLGS
jgi:hypothetical protein